MAVLPIGIGAEEGGYQIERSLRFNSADSAYLSRTPASAGNRKTWTWSGWVKRSTIIADNTDNVLFWAGAASTGQQFTYISFATYTPSGIQNSIRVASGIWGSSNDFDFGYSNVYRDLSAWYHIVVAYDSTQATASNRIKVYVNGSQITSSPLGYAGRSTTTSLNYDTAVNNTVSHTFGNATVGYFNGYLAEVHFIDGQALDPTSFGEFNSDTGVWQPKAYTGSYGTNGFYLDFADNSSTTALGYDAAGSNDWTPNNFSVTAGSGNDSLVDVPTPYGVDSGAGGEVRGNYATWNPLDRGNTTYSNGNLDSVTTSNTAPYNITTTIQLPTSGKWYCEVTATKGANSPLIGIGNNRPTDQVLGYRSNGTYINVGVTGPSSSGTPATWTTGDVIGIAYDAGAGTLSFYKNGTLQSGGFTSIPATGYCVAVRADSASGDGGTLNPGQRAFAYSAPSGFKALCTQNLPEPTVVDGGEYFGVLTYTGNGTSGHEINGLQFQPNFSWFKNRSAAWDHILVDSVRGVSNELYSNLTSAEFAGGRVTSLDSDGVTVSADPRVNASGNGIVAWNWKANGAGVSNTDGTITSTVSANTTAGFSIVTYTGNQTAGATVGHGLGAKPALIIPKCRGAATSWPVYHTSLGATKWLLLNSTQGTTTTSQEWNNTEPTSSVFTIGNSSSNSNQSSTYVAYVFAPVAGYSAFGSYVGNGSTDGPFVYTGFRVRYILVKRTDSASDWFIMDTARNTYNTANALLGANVNYAESTYASTNYVDFLSNGFKIRQDNSNGYQNASGGTYIYAAFAENPFKYALAR